MIPVAKCDDCSVYLRATEDLLSSLSARRGMSKREIERFVFLRHGLDFEKADQLVSELKRSRVIEGNAKRFTLSSQKGGAKYV